ncbi:MAG TPA: hypothetical protein VEC35_23485 [Noviherbaspirillum sp.]|nr:hypothetical protein [Noviherbaspirillum sp.]
MKQSIAATHALAALLISASAFAAGAQHHDEHKAQYGGVVTEVKETQYELVAKPDSIAIYVDDHGKKVDTKGATAKVTLLNGSEKTETPLSPAGENKLEAKGVFKVEKETKAVAVVTLAGKPAQSVRFTFK